MSEQTKVSFTKGKGNTYISEEVDVYLAMLHSAYEEMEKELKDIENKLAKERARFGNIKDLEKKNTEMENVRELEVFYEGKVIELERVICSMKEGFKKRM